MNGEKKFVEAMMLKQSVLCRMCKVEKPPSQMAVISRRAIECHSCRVAPRACTVCNIVKPLSDFYNCRQGRRLAPCAACEVARQAQIKRDTPPAQWMFDRVRHRAKAEGKEFTITVSDIVIPSHCPILGIALAPVGQSPQSSATPTLDRLDATRGYIPGNVAVLSLAGNALKGKGTAAQHEIVAAWMRSKGLK